MPDFHGNRSPRADPTLRGMISGMTLDGSLDDLAILYLATIQALAYGTRHILEGFPHSHDTLCVTGGLSKNPLYLQTHADVTGCQVLISRESEAVLVGSSMLGAVAGGLWESLDTAMSHMSHSQQLLEPESLTRDFHETKYKIFHQMFRHQMEYRELMKEFPVGRERLNL